jgi:pectinesterase
MVRADGGINEPRACPPSARYGRRAVLGGMAAMFGTGTPLSARPAQWDVIVGGKGRAHAATLGEALERARGASDRPFRIKLTQGLYREKLVIGTPNLLIEGEGPDTILSFDAAAGLARPDGGRWGTGGSATLIVNAPGVTLRNLTVRNAFDFIDDQRTHASGGSQAVALSLARGADRTWVDRCRIEGYQDTLYVEGHALFTDCSIAGGVDFIFGGAAGWFERCAITTRFVPDAPIQGYVAAPSTPSAHPFGLVFADCRLLREAGVPDRSSFLGRPWRAGGNMDLVGAATYLRCWMDAHIRAEGWSAMGYRDPTGAQKMLAPREARLAEWASLGPGAGPASDSRRLLDANDAARFTRANVLAGWDPAREL